MKDPHNTAKAKPHTQNQLTDSQLQALGTSPPALFMPPADHAHDLYALSAHIQGFEHLMYQDIQEDHAMYDSLQRWPHLFAAVLGNLPPGKS